MDHWIEELEEMMTSNGITVHLLVKYVDEVLFIGDKVKLGNRFLDGKVQYRETWEEEDREQSLTEEDVTFRIIQGMANSILDFLEFTGEFCKAGNKMDV